MLLLKYLPLHLLLLLLDIAPPASASSSNLISRTIRRAHDSAFRHTQDLSRDLRVAFRGVLTRRDVLTSRDTADTAQTRALVYCKVGGQNPFAASSNGSTGVDGTSPATAGTPGSTPSSLSMSSMTRSSMRASTSNTKPTSTSASTRSSTTATTGTTKTTTKTTTTSTTSPTTTATSPWKLAESHSGSTFFDGWTFFTEADPTDGIVTYIDQATALSNGLASINTAGNAVMRLETTATVAATRMSVRITTASTWNGGLFVLDAVHMPSGCGVWPAFWTTGPNWPAAGEIDILEGVNDYSQNQMTAHTLSGCALGTSSELPMTGTVVTGTDCSAADTSNQGCGVRAAGSGTYGAGYNSAGGGVSAMQWDANGIAIYFFARGAIPADITAGAPTPASWGDPQAFWPASACSPFEFFNTQSAIFDTTLCGQWAGGVWADAGIPGQEQSCAARTGVATCEEYVLANGAAFEDAYWEVQSVKIYQAS